MCDSRIATAAVMLSHVMDMQYFRSHVEHNEESEKMAPDKNWCLFAPVQ